MPLKGPEGKVRGGIGLSRDDRGEGRVYQMFYMCGACGISSIPPLLTWCPSALSPNLSVLCSPLSGLGRGARRGPGTREEQYRSQ